MEINDIFFKNKSQLLTYTRNLIKEIGIGTITKDNQYFNFFNELIKRHSEYELKKGSGIKSFIIKQNVMNKKAFELNILRTDKTIVDISFIHCCNLINNNQLLKAMRWSIRKQILKFRKNTNLICNICNICENNNCEFHVDHKKPFSILVSEFLKNKSNIPNNFIECEKTNNPKFKEEDIQFKKEWKKYHKKECELQILCSKCNLKKSNKFI
jgi:hypothetical protein